MITENFKVEKVEAKVYPPIPENVYTCELLDITTKETFKYQSTTEKENTLSFQFTLLDGKDKDGTLLRGRNIWRNNVPTYLYEGAKGKNLLYQIVENSLGRILTREEELMMDSSFLNSLIGKQCRIITKNKPDKKGKIWNNIETYLAIENKLPSLTEEEKDKARIKEKKETIVEEEDEQTTDNVHPFPTNQEAVNEAVDEVFPKEWQ
jgi:hypothetical protein